MAFLLLPKAAHDTAQRSLPSAPLQSTRPGRPHLVMGPMSWLTPRPMPLAMQK